MIKVKVNKENIEQIKKKREKALKDSKLIKK